MKRLLFFLLIFSAAIWVGLQFKQDTGYALFVYQGWTIEMPLWFTVLSILLGTWLLHRLLALLAGISHIPKRFYTWSKQRQLYRSQILTGRGLIQLAEGQWPTAEKNLIRAAPTSENPLINYLAAARAAQEQGAYERRDDYLRIAHQTTPNAELAVGMVQAQLQLSHKQLEQSLATLKRLKELAPQHRYVLKLLQQIYLELQDWESWATLLPELLKHHILKPHEVIKIGEKVFQELLIRAAGDAEKLHAVWKQIPKCFQQNPVLLRTYSQRLVNLNKGAEVISRIRDTLTKTWDDELVRLYGLIKTTDPRKQLIVAETWLKMHDNDPILLLTLGRLALSNQLWGKARHYFEASLNLSKNPETYRELAQLLGKLGIQSLAENYYREGLTKATQRDLT